MYLPTCVLCLVIKSVGKLNVQISTIHSHPHQLSIELWTNLCAGGNPKTAQCKLDSQQSICFDNLLYLWFMCAVLSVEQTFCMSSVV